MLKALLDRLCKRQPAAQPQVVEVEVERHVHPDVALSWILATVGDEDTGVRTVFGDKPAQVSFWNQEEREAMVIAARALHRTATRFVPRNWEPEQAAIEQATVALEAMARAARAQGQGDYATWLECHG